MLKTVVRFIHPTCLTCASRPLARVAAVLAALACISLPLSASAAPVPGQGSWETSLQPRLVGGEVVAWYDTVLDITWLADANFAQTSGFDDDGLMTFSQANAWAAGLDLFGGSEWRLPTLSPVNGVAFDLTFSNNGSTDLGTARTGVGWGTASEMGYMFYVHLGNLGFCTPNDASPGICAPQAGGGLSNTGPFANLLLDTGHWTDTAFVDTASASTLAWGFAFDFGFQADDAGEDIDAAAWAVHAGDLIGSPPMPEPQAVPLPVAAVVALAALLIPTGLRRNAPPAPRAAC
jgi:hypothetical protein